MVERKQRSVERFLRDVATAAAGAGTGSIQAMDAMEAKFADNKEAILGLITVFQKSTRQMHNVVNESKARKDAALAAKVPMVKKTLERFVFRVKLLSETSGGGELKFWVGNLKHRDLKGQEISSQMELEEDDDPLSDEEGTEADELLAADHDQHADLAALDDEQRSELGSEYT
jgi:Fanconi anemia group D2 protein